MIPAFPQAHAHDAITPDSRQSALTQKWIEPALPLITEGITRIRAKTDAHFEALRDKAQTQYGPEKAGLTNILEYPYGYCDKIRDIVWNSLCHSLQAGKNGGAYFRVLDHFLKEGGVFRRIWGELTYGPYFQNAIQVGTYYVDAANDTVVVTKPKLDIKPITEASFANINSFEHYFRVAESYYQWDTYPNGFFPELAAFYPGIAIHKKTGVLLICDIPKPLFYKNIQSGGKLAETFFASVPFKAKKISEAYHATLGAFRESSLLPLLTKAQKNTPEFRAALPACGQTSITPAFQRLTNWLMQGHDTQHYIRGLATIDSFRKKASNLLRQHSITVATGTGPSPPAA